MNIPQAIDILREYNAWRRGDDDAEALHPTDIGHAIDSAIKHMQYALEAQSMAAKMKSRLTDALGKVAELHAENKVLRKAIDAQD
jgi:hypothetical protein